ncbi:dnaJ/Hsp40 cysteine-rich domain superfamily protein [Tasmannia lanceolata]|uniref:dnaJ/Hsp40 cysteine-rich domain superfamily protein n=1 Tax=Tasmannia lanceolata TaxID=3420 RepID=UPI00406445E9
MANALCFNSIYSFKSPIKPGFGIGSEAPKVRCIDFVGARNANFRILKAKAEESKESSGGVKRNSILCTDCNGNGAKVCTQCEGYGVNSVDHFNGQFKAGGLCWLCRGKREILCGNCNGAGFMGGFMSTADS